MKWELVSDWLDKKVRINCMEKENSFELDFGFWILVIQDLGKTLNLTELQLYSGHKAVGYNETLDIKYLSLCACYVVVLNKW